MTHRETERETQIANIDAEELRETGRQTNKDMVTNTKTFSEQLNIVQWQKDSNV